VQRRWLLVGLLALGLTIPSAAVATGTDIDGFLQANGPVQLDGNLTHTGTSETVWLSTPDNETVNATVSYHADTLRITRLELDIQAVDDSQTPLTVYPPGEKVTRSVDFFENVTFEVEEFGPTADFLVFSADGAPFHTAIEGDDTSTTVEREGGGLDIQDGYRERNNFTDQGSDEFFWDYKRPGPIVHAATGPEIQLGGAAESYVWDTTVRVFDENGTQARYETGAEIRRSQDGTVRDEHYEYLLVEARGLEADIEPTGLDGGLYAEAMDFNLDGEATLQDASGSLTGDDTTYQADDARQSKLVGDLDLTLTPQANRVGHLTVDVDGQLEASTLTPVSQGALLDDTSTLAVGAGSATAIGVAVWYMLGAKGLTLAFPAARTRPHGDERDVAPANVDRPRDLLFDPDRFALYHLVRSRPGLTADTCRETTGIGPAREHLDLLVEHGLLDAIDHEPRRYALPGAIDEEEADLISFLRQRGALDLAEVLTVHGLVPEDKLKQRLAQAAADVDQDTADALIEGFVERDLAYREPGEGGDVVDPRDRLFTLLERMGESEVPRVS